MLVAQRVATMHSTVEFGLGKSCIEIIHVGIYLRILTGIHSPVTASGALHGVIAGVHRACTECL